MDTQYIIDRLMSHGVPGNDAEVLAAVGYSESNFNPNAEGDSGDSIGIFQINLPAHGEEIASYSGSYDRESWKDWLKDPDNNIFAAAQIYQGSGLSAWTKFNDGSYKDFLGQNLGVGGGMVTGDIEGLSSSLLAGLNKLADAFKQTINIDSGYRTIDEQAELYNAASDEDKGVMVAAPGESKHNFGLAADVGRGSFVTDLGNDVLEQYGLIRPMSWENWHIQPINENQEIATTGKKTLWNYIKEGPFKITSTPEGGTKRTIAGIEVGKDSDSAGNVLKNFFNPFSEKNLKIIFIIIIVIMVFVAILSMMKGEGNSNGTN
jgi:hypothetical protein